MLTIGSEKTIPIPEGDGLGQRLHDLSEVFLTSAMIDSGLKLNIIQVDNDEFWFDCGSRFADEHIRDFQIPVKDA